jgi:hypothetical protein
MCAVQFYHRDGMNAPESIRGYRRNCDGATSSIVPCGKSSTVHKGSSYVLYLCSANPSSTAPTCIPGARCTVDTVACDFLRSA